MANPWDQDPPEDSVQNPWDADPPSNTAVATSPSMPPSGYLTEDQNPPGVIDWLMNFLKGTHRDAGVPITNPQAEMPGYVVGKQSMDVAKETSPYILGGLMTGGAAAPYLMSGTVGGILGGAAIEGLSQAGANVFKQIVNQTDDPLSMIQDLGMGAAFSAVPASIATKIAPAAGPIMDELKQVIGGPLRGIMGEDVKPPVNMIDNAPEVTPASDEVVASPAPVSPAKQPTASQTLYHGTNADNIGEFKSVSKSVNSTTFGDVSTERHGIFFSDNPSFAKEYGKNVGEVNVRIENPAEITPQLKQQFVDTIDPFKERDLWLLAKYSKHDWGLFEGELGGRFVKFLKGEGYDGAKFYEEIPISGEAGGYVDGTTWVALDSKQVVHPKVGSFRGKLSEKAPTISDKPAVSPQGAGDVTLGAFGGIDDATLRDIAQKGKALAKETPAPDAGTAIETFGRPVQNFERGWGERVYNNFSTKFGKIVPDFLKNPNKRISLEQSKAVLQSIPDAQSEADLLKNAWDAEWSAVRRQSGDITAEMVTSGNAPAVKAFTDKLYQAATDAGIPLNKLQNYLTRETKAVIGERMSDDFIKLRRVLGKASEEGKLTDQAVEAALAKTSKDTQEAVRHLVDTKRAKSVRDAYDILGSRFEEDLTQSYGVKRLYKTSFEKARGATLPDRYYETNVNTLMRNYIAKMSKRVTAAKKFGVNGEKMTDALNKIGKYDQSEQKFVSDVFDLYTGKYQLEHGLSGGAQKTQRAVTNLIIAGKIGTGLSTVANSLQIASSAIPQVGYWRAVKGGTSLLAKSGRAYARAIAGDYRGFEEALGGFQDKAFTSKLTHLLTEGTGFNATNYMNLILGSSMYKPYVQDLYKIAQGKGARALWAKSNLADLGIDVSQKLEDDVLARAVHTLTFDSQLMEKVSTSPFYLNNPRLRWMTSLKKFSVNQFIRNKDMVFKEASRGNVMPFLRLAAAGVAGGEAIIWAKNKIKSALPGNPPQYRKEDAMWERIANDVAASGTLGVFTDVFSADNPTELINKISQAATPAPISIGLAAKDEAKIVAKRAETVGIGPAMRKEAGDIASVIGGAYAGGAANAIFQTPGDVKENLTYRRSQEKAAINNLFVQGKNEAAQKRIALWNKNNPEHGFKGKEFTNKGIKKIVKKRAEKKYEAEQ